MEEIQVASPAPGGAAAVPPRRSLFGKSRGDLALNSVLVILLLAVLGLGGWLGYSVWAQQQADKMSNPAYRAIAPWQASVKKSPNNAQLRLRLGEVYAQAKMYPEAMTQFRAALKLDPKYAGAYQDIAAVAVMQNDLKTAQGALQQVLVLTNDEFAASNPRREDTYFHLGEIALMQKHYDDAAGYFKAALRIRNDGADTHFDLAKAYEGQGDNGAAEKELKVAVAFDSKYPDAFYELGKLYLADKNYKEAALNLRTAAINAPGSSQPTALLAQIGTADSWIAKAAAAMKAGDLKTADTDAQIAIAIDPNAASAKAYAQILEREGNAAKALKFYTKALELAPKDPDVKAAVARLSKHK